MMPPRAKLASFYRNEEIILTRIPHYYVNVGAYALHPAPDRSFWVFPVRHEMSDKVGLHAFLDFVSRVGRERSNSLHSLLVLTIAESSCTGSY